MDEQTAWATHFEAERTRLRAVAYRMLGSLSEADDAVQEAWLRLNRTSRADIENLSGWLTTVTARICLNMLRTRATRREAPLDRQMPDPIVSAIDGGDPEHAALLADAVGLALLVVLDTLTPAERLAFVLHDLFAVPFEEIAPLIARTSAATRQLASRARRRVRDEAPSPDTNSERQRAAVEAFFTATRDGDFDALLTVLDPGVVLRSDGGTARKRQTITLQGARSVAEQALTFAQLAPLVRPALINGAAGVVVAHAGQILSIMGFSVVQGKIVAIDVLADPARLAQHDLTALVGIAHAS
jgi:RNA polymerase sigma-70 factor (ECF subfamily)